MRAESHEKEIAAYTFSTRPLHEIIEKLNQPLTGESSYKGITISRDQLENFVEFLKHAEKAERAKKGEQFHEKDDLGYKYDRDQGKGSHETAHFGRGIKPIIMSHPERLLTIKQMQDLRAVLIQKGLIPVAEALK